MSLDPLMVVMAELPGMPPIVDPLKRWAKRLGARLGDPKCRVDLFPELNHEGGPFGPMKTHRWVDEMRKHLQQANVPDAHRFTLHSGRATARTTLARRGLPKLMSKTALGWTSDASEGYDRRAPTELVSEMVRAYQTVWDEVGGSM
jgi:integrase